MLRKISLIFLCVAVFVSCGGKKPAAAEKVIVWTYDSFVSEWGPGAEIARRFAEDSGLSLEWKSAGDAGALLAGLLQAGNKANADIVLGLDQNMADTAVKTGLFRPYKPAGAEKILPGLVPAGDFSLIPFDYSYFSIIYDSETVRPPENLQDLTSGEYKRRLILMDPRSSSPGLGFLAWTISAYGDDFFDYWQQLAPSILTVAESWDTGYGLFAAGEAPLVLSYTTSPGYHLEYEASERYRAAIFADGHPVQVELAGILKAAPNKEGAAKFMDFMLSDRFQETIPLGNWMYPVTDIELPPSFRINTKPEKIIQTAPVTNAQLDKWATFKK